MIIIPSTDKKYSQPNNSDLFGNLAYTKNLNFDEKGYVKLSSRAVSVMSSQEDAAFQYPYSIGRKDTGGNFNIATSNRNYFGSYSPLAFSTTDDGAGAAIPVGSFYNRGKWWKNAWHVTSATSMKYKDGVTNTWASSGVTLTTGFPHPLEIFKTRLTLCVGDGNTVIQFDTGYAHSSTTDLVLSTDYTVTGLSFSNSNRLGVATQLSSTLSGQNQDAMFYVWKGTGNTPDLGFPVGSDAILGVASYKSSWVILTRHGKLLYFNGGGFDELATLPYFFKKLDFQASAMQGDVLIVENDLIYINMPAVLTYYGIKQEQYLQNFPGGILCYDPNVGLYHRYSPSTSKAYGIASGSSLIDTTTDTITVGAGTLPSHASPIMYTSDPSNPIGGLTMGTVYYLIKLSSTTFKLATSKANAIAMQAIDLTSTGASAAYFVGVDVVDYGASIYTQANGMALFGKTSYTYDHMIFGGEFTNGYGSTTLKGMCLTIPEFTNIGYLVTSKITSQQKKDNFKAVNIKYRPLGVNDKFILKIKDKDVRGLPVSTPQRGKTCSWTSTTTFTTTADISEAYTYLQTSGNQLECEIIGGTGAGQISQISSIQLAGTTYTITLAEEIDGAAVGRYCDIIIDNWKKYGEITSADADGEKQIPVNRVSKWAQFKLEFRGSKTTFEEMQIINTPHTPTKA